VHPLQLCAAAVLATTFLTAAIGKLRSRRAFTAFATALGQFGVPRRRRRPAAAVVILAELLAVAALVVPIASPFPRLGPGLALLAGLSVALAIAARRHPDLACHCFGSDDTTPVGVHLLLNAAVLALGLAALVLPGSASMLPGTRVFVIGLGLIIGGLAVVAVPVLEAIGPRGLRPTTRLTDRS
jgi:hypothetical protein